MTKDSVILHAGNVRDFGAVEVTEHEDHAVTLRQTSAGGTTTLEFTPSEWNAFVAGAKAGEFDQPW